MKKSVYVAVVLSLFANGVAAQGISEPEVPQHITNTIQRYNDKAADYFAKRMLEIDPDGILRKDTVKAFAIRARAVSRAAEMEKFLIHDLDLNGVLSVDEISQLKRYNATSRRPDRQIVFRLLKADQDFDGELSFQEMSESIIASTPDLTKYLGRTRDLQALFFFDRDKDGTVTLQEMLQGVDEMSAPCDC